MSRLTPAQRKLLSDLAERPHFVAPFYEPGKALQKLGYVEVRDGRFSTVTHITEAGRAALKTGERRDG